jgi:hypothetical protein
MSPSVFNIIYKGMTDEQRRRLEEDISKALLKASGDFQGILTREVEKAVTTLYNQLAVNPWPSIVRENAGVYDFITAMTEQIWEAMLKSNPKENSQFDIAKLLDAYKKNYPAEWAELVGKDTADKYKKLEDLYEFQCRVEQGRR